MISISVSELPSSHFSQPRIELLREQTPGPKAVRVWGTLDTTSATKSDVVLTLSHGTAVAARLDAHDNAQLGALCGFAGGGVVHDPVPPVWKAPRH